MFTFLFALWLILNGRITLEICLFGVVIAGAVYAFCVKALGYSPRHEKIYLRRFWLYGVFVVRLVWEILKANYPVGTVIEAPVVGTPSFGAFVRILPGIDGLVHISQLSTSHVNAPTDVVKEGDLVRAVITEVDLEKKRISLSIRRLLEAEAEAAAEAEADEDADEADGNVINVVTADDAPAAE